MLGLAESLGLLNTRRIRYMSLSDLSPSTQNYLKIIWGLNEHSDKPVTTSLIATQAGLKQSSVSDALKRLKAAELISHRPYGAVELTETGRFYALSMVRRHRLIETFLVETLGYTWDQVHDEAEVLEHAVSDTMIDRIDALLGHPSRDPHGDPIPLLDGKFTLPRMVSLLSYIEQKGYPLEHQRLVIERISDSDPQLLRLLANYGVVPGAQVSLIARDPVHLASAQESQKKINLPLTLQTEEGKKVDISQQQASAVYISSLEQ